mmetsp:Transcript_3651/g.8701  ORF Transcript_3651/g.8701 Transcript_3651/m.8701 type:complete len:216 (-) Transcript_3651:1177-1824(-)
MLQTFWWLEETSFVHNLCTLHRILRLQILQHTHSTPPDQFRIDDSYCETTFVPPDHRPYHAAALKCSTSSRRAVSSHHIRSHSSVGVGATEEKHSEIQNRVSRNPKMATIRPHYPANACLVNEISWSFYLLLLRSFRFSIRDRRCVVFLLELLLLLLLFFFPLYSCCMLYRPVFCEFVEPIPSITWVKMLLQSICPAATTLTRTRVVHYIIHTDD